MISVKHLYKSMPTGPLLEDISFVIGNKEKVGLLGQNGCGKSTLLKVLIGVEDYDSGTVSIENEVVAYLPQLFEQPESSVREFGRLLLQDKAYEFERQLSRLGLPEASWDIAISNLSSGQRMRVKLAELLVDNPSVLILDEPTNHLDIEGIQWIEAFVKSFGGIVILVSHDRAFLDAVCTHIFEIDEKQLLIFPGNYTDYKTLKQQWIEEREKTYKRQEQKRKQLATLIENARRLQGGKARGKAVRAAKKRMEREVLRSEVGRYKLDVITQISFSGTTHTGKLMLQVDGIQKSFEKANVLNDVSFELRGNERAWLYGANGAGKSTLLNLISGIVVPTEGEVVIGHNVRWGYFRQNQEHLPFDETVETFFRNQAGISDYRLYGILKKYLFPQEYLSRKIGTLSPGERARLGFAVFTQQNLDLLILDEPTNHLDIWTKEAIEGSLREFEGGILLVSHDRYFVENVGVDTVYHLKNGTLTKLLT